MNDTFCTISYKRCCVAARLGLRRPIPGGLQKVGYHTLMDRISSLRLRLAELTQMRRDYEAQRKPHFVDYLQKLITEVERDIADIERISPAPQASKKQH